jgi:hypothetical protein
MKIFLVIILGFSFSIKAQKLIRWNVNSIGLSVKSDEIYLSQSIGQSSITGSNHNSENKLRHGFQQPFQLNSFNTITNHLNFRIFPNPSNGIFNIEPLFINRSSYSISVYNHLGQLVAFENDIIGFKKFELNELKPGSYLIEINCELKKHVFNLIIIP